MCITASYASLTMMMSMYACWGTTMRFCDSCTASQPLMVSSTMQPQVDGQGHACRRLQDWSASLTARVMAAPVRSESGPTSMTCILSSCTGTTHSVPVK